MALYNNCLKYANYDWYSLKLLIHTALVLSDTCITTL